MKYQSLCSNFSLHAEFTFNFIERFCELFLLFHLIDNAKESLYKGLKFENQNVKGWNQFLSA